MDDLYTLEAAWTDTEDVPDTTEAPVEVLATSCRAAPGALMAFARTVDRCAPAAPALMAWLRISFVGSARDAVAAAPCLP